MSSKLSELQALLKHKKSVGYYAKKLGISELEVKELLNQLKNPKNVNFVHTCPCEGECTCFKEIKFEYTTASSKINEDKGTLESSVETSFEPKSHQELAKLHKIDLNKYKISQYWSKLKPNGKFTSSVFCTLKKPEQYTLEDFTNFLKTWEPSKFYKEVKSYPSEGKQVVDIEVNLSDFHLAKRSFQKDTINSKEFDYYKVLTNLISSVKSNYNIRKIVFPISNDFFHTDTYHNTTTNGTPQDVTVWYDEEYEKGFDILANAINFLLTESEQLEVILVQGNHDRTKGFFVAHALEKFFGSVKEDKIKFKRHHSVMKHTVVGNTFIGYHHGNTKSIEGLPIIFATSPESAVEFSKAKYREVHTGDKHHYLAKEINSTGVRVQQVPSLSMDDRWHVDNNYINQIRAGLAFVYHPEKGKICEFEERL